MIFENFADYESWLDQKEEGYSVDFVALEVHPEQPLDLNIWKCTKAAKYGKPVICFILGYNWKLMREKMINIPYQRDFDYRTPQEALTLAGHLEGYVEAVVILNPDLFDPGSINIDYSAMSMIENEKHRELMRGCFSMSWVFRQKLSRHRCKQRLFFAFHGPMYFIGAKATERILTEVREMLVETEIPRGAYDLVRSATNELRIKLLLQEKPELEPEISALHQKAIEYAETGQTSLDRFHIDTVHTMSYTGYPFKDKAKLDQVFFELNSSEWPYGLVNLKDTIYRDKV